MGAYLTVNQVSPWDGIVEGGPLSLLPSRPRQGQGREQHTLVALLAPPGKRVQHGLVAAAQSGGKSDSAPPLMRPVRDKGKTG